MRTASILAVVTATFLALPAFGQEATRDDFNEFAKAMKGRWVGDVTWVANWAGLGNRGDKVTAYAEYVLAEDGNALLTKFYGGSGSATGIIAYDAAKKRIKWRYVTSGGYTAESTVYKKNGNWIEDGVGSTADGKKNLFLLTVLISDGGKTHSWTGSGTLDGKKVDDLNDVWRRVSK